MPVNQKQLASDFGFKSPGFLVSDTGALVAASVNASSLLINGNPILASGGDTLSPVVRNSSLETIGTLSNLTVNGNVSLKQGSVQRISIVDGRVRISSGLLGSIDNVDIGLTTPARVTATRIDVTSSLNASDVTMNMNNPSITGAVTFIDGITVPTVPTTAGQAASKGYVDNSLIAFSVAFGA
jgi:hypothetical protein